MKDQFLPNFARNRAPESGSVPTIITVLPTVESLLEKLRLNWKNQRDANIKFNQDEVNQSEQTGQPQIFSRPENSHIHEWYKALGLGVLISCEINPEIRNYDEVLDKFELAGRVCAALQNKYNDPTLKEESKFWFGRSGFDYSDGEKRSFHLSSDLEKLIPSEMNNRDDKNLIAIRFLEGFLDGLQERPALNSTHTMMNPDRTSSIITTTAENNNKLEV